MKARLACSPQDEPARLEGDLEIEEPHVEVAALDELVGDDDRIEIL
jgi:hypothetical protein